MSKHHAPAKLPRGTVALPASAIGGMSLAVALGFQSVGLNARIDASLLGWLNAMGLGTTPVVLPAAIGWGLSLLFGFGLSFAILESPGHARRAMLWLSTLVIVMGLLPVLGLSAKWWSQAPLLVSVVWSGLCSIIYATRHWMPCEGGNARPRKQAR